MGVRVRAGAQEAALSSRASSDLQPERKRAISSLSANRSFDIKSCFGMEATLHLFLALQFELQLELHCDSSSSSSELRLVILLLQTNKQTSEWRRLLILIRSRQLAIGGGSKRRLVSSNIATALLALRLKSMAPWRTRIRGRESRRRSAHCSSGPIADKKPAKRVDQAKVTREFMPNQNRTTTRRRPRRRAQS